MERIHPAPAQPVLQGKARIFSKISVEEISRAVRQFAPDYCGNCVNDELQALFDSIRYSASIDVVGLSRDLAHSARLQVLYAMHICRPPQLGHAGNDSFTCQAKRHRHE